MSETAYQRYFRRRSEELVPMREALDKRAQEIEDELQQAQKACSPHIDNGHMIEGSCVKCGKLLG